MELINNNLQWFTGIVEDRMDPLERGRVRVRVHGLHPFQKTQGPISGVPTEDLPWMSVIFPITSAAMSGISGSTTGPVEGTAVYGHFLDKYRQNAIILGTYSVNASGKPNYTEGFSDPTGQYPRYIGNDTNVLNRGGAVGIDSISNIIQDSNLDIGLNPDDSDLSDIPEDPNPDYTMDKMLRRDEGLRVKVYWDTEGFPTIGIGHLIMSQKVRDMTQINKVLSNQVGREVTGNPGSITMEEATVLFNKDLADMQRDIKSNKTISPVYVKVNRSRQMALENMAFQMGVGGLAKFTKMLDAMYVGDWKTAYKEGRNSTWYSQTKGRASRVTMIILTGNMESYGIPAPKPESRSLSAALAVVTESDDPANPPTPFDGRVLFKEPPSSYNGQYPYVHAMESESGHIQEFDDTPGYERYRLIHPTGSYVEVAPDGRRTTKTVSDLYDITNGDGNYLVSGDKNVNVGGNEVQYNMANLRRQTDGSENIFIRGNETKTIEGNGTLIVKGNVKVIIQGTADITVEQEAYVTVEKDTTINVNQNADISVKQKATVNAENMDINVEREFNLNATDINFSASNTVHMDGGSLAKVSGGNVQVG